MTCGKLSQYVVSCRVVFFARFLPAFRVVISTITTGFLFVFRRIVDARDDLKGGPLLPVFLRHVEPVVSPVPVVVIPVSEPVQVRDESPTISRFSGCPTRPPKTYDSDLIVVLDLDECLIHSEFGRDGDASRTHQVQRGPGEMQGVDGHVQSFNVSDDFKVNMRPHVAEFLEAVTERYETYLFTAGTQSYANAVLDKLDPDGRFAGRLYRQHCVFDSGVYVKDLSILGIQRLHRTVLLDNNYMSFRANPLNGIPIADFFDNPQDGALLPMLDVFRSLENVPDVRPVLGRWYNVLDVLRNPLITTSVPVVIPVSEPVQVRDESPTISRFSGCTIRPPKKYDSDLIVVLDLDECLIHSEFFRDGDASRTHQVEADPGEKQGVDGHVQSFNVSDFCKVNMRPHVAEFLEAVTGRYETYIFTAGTQKYADAVLDKLEPTRSFSWTPVQAALCPTIWNLREGFKHSGNAATTSHCAVR